jgi:hypothetical protein
MFCAERTIGLEIIFDAPNETPRRRGSWEYRFGLFGDGVSVKVKIGAQFAPHVPYAQKSFWTHPMVLLGDEAQVEAHFSLFGDSANLDVR